MPIAIRAVVACFVVGLLLPPSTALASNRPTVPAAGEVEATLLAPSQGHEPATKAPKPFHTMHPDALKRAKVAAEAAVAPSSGTPSTAPTQAATTVFNGLDKPGLAASDEGNTATPPDPTGAIGPNDYIEMVNQLVAVYDRNTLALISSTSFASFAHVPNGLGTSDPQIEWDPVANRWLYAMVGVATGNNYLLFGWTKTADPTNLTGGWCTFGVFTGTHLQDYPKLGHDASWVVVGSNAYSDVNSSFPFETAQVWAFPKPAASDSTCSSSVKATFFADANHPLKNADGTLSFTPVPANTTDSGSDYIVGTRDVTLGPASKVMVWHMAAGPTLVADGDITVDSYSIPPGVPQPGTSYLIDSLDGRLTQAVARFDPSAGAEALWTQQTIAGGAGTVVRWYEFLPVTGILRQEGQVSGATDYYWNGAISPSAAGNDAAVFYNRGSATQLSLIGAQTRTSSTPSGQMDSGEIVLATSSAPITEDAFQTNCNPNPCRWGDYSGATPDLVNSHVVWGSGEISGPAFFGFAQWQTQNYAVSTVPPPPDFSLSASPASQTVIQGSSATITVNVARIGGFSGSVTLTVSGLPAGASGAFSPNPATGASSTLTVTADPTTAVGSYPLTVTGTGGSLTHTASATLVVSAPPPPDFSLSVSPGSQTINQGATTAYTVNVTRVSGFGGAVTLSVSGLPATAAGSFSPNPATANASTLTVTSSGSISPGSYPLTITGTSGSLTHAASATLVVSPPPPCSSATLSPAATSQPVGATIHFTATASGCSSPQFEYWVQYLDGSYHVLRAFSSVPTFDWNTAGFAVGSYPVIVWANQAGDPTSTWEASASSTVTLTGCTAATLSPPSANVTAGSTVHFTAGASGCPNPQFEYWVQYLDGTWHVVRAFDVNPIFDWNTSGFGPGTYSVQVWANNVGDGTSTWEAFASSTVTLSGGACTSATITPTTTSQSVGSTIHFAAGASGCPTPQFSFWVQYLDGSWHNLRPFSTTATWDWSTAGLTPGVYSVTVWANQVGDPTSTWEAFASSSVTLTGGCTGASVTPSSPTVQVASTIQFTASATGCPNPQFEYWAQYLDGSWHMVRAFSSDPTFSWNTSGLGTGAYTISVWAVQTGDSTSTWEAFGTSKVTLTGCTSASVTASSSSVSGGGSITFTASAAGCSSPVFEFWLQDPGGGYHLMQGFASSSTWTWNTSGWAPGTYHVIVWANQQGADTSTWETFASLTVTVS
ncbi:MAG TPA: hypothetical protein VFL27_08440 [Candidatus Dormibacteraeota bacterium]|nr:hypothetical protein [Candidatus Dormibacteraeota bacterium]